MNFDPEERRRKTNTLMHSIYDYGMGVLWLGLGIFFLLHDKFGIEITKLDTTLTTIFGVICIMYGLFRFYRGYKKNY
jgi:hypothetical protein